jgi:ribosome modulation factor
MSNILDIEKSKAYESGYADYFNGLGKHDNPFCEESQAEWFDDWENGWLKADSDSDDN